MWREREGRTLLKSQSRQKSKAQLTRHLRHQRTTTMSLSDKLAELTLDISDKSKTIDLLKNIISQQQGRHAVEISKCEKEMEESLKKASTEKDEALQELFKTNEEILLKKKALESRVEELAVEKQVGSSQPFLTPSLHRVQLT